ncbi:3-oxo-tetronate 4-phosphate decarboxylase [Methylobrevis albus]|uniref:3-oxo-tetronate 4-phosphate decarboxylase n=1 Tax=Methylobrevis albus TaxID=2793297 RepID=A0A931MYZ2_9HYPH|nr:3-oxo-tetronate 4-phosphate decarboxylase [Methylobrevis albus]MBH0238495.1 aldolase [Methylobrevis albus]
MALSEEGRLREAICDFGRSLFDRGLTAGSSGNISVALDDGGWLMTPTNASLGRLDPARISKLGADGRLVSGDAPTKEIPLHRAVYDVRGGARAIVHLHSHYSVAASLLEGIDAASMLPPLTPYFVMKVGRLPLVPYFRPGDPSVADVIRDLARHHAAVMLANHGPVVSGESLDAAVNAIEELEATSRLFVDLHGKPHRALSEAQIEELRQTFGAVW